MKASRTWCCGKEEKIWLITGLFRHGALYDCDTFCSCAALLAKTFLPSAGRQALTVSVPLHEYAIPSIKIRSCIWENTVFTLLLLSVMPLTFGTKEGRGINEMDSCFEGRSSVDLRTG